MSAKRVWINNSWIRVLQHVAFWALSFYVFLHIFKIGVRVEKIDFVYAALFHASILPVVYLNIMLLLPKLKHANRWWYVPLIILMVLFFSWINYGFFDSWSNAVLPEYFFISYFSFWQVLLFFVVYLSITSLLKLSRSWFTINELEKELLIAEKQKAELELMALRSQMNPHFIFNCMNSIKSLIQQNEDEKAVDYLTTFSRLIRTIFQNSDKREVSLFDELETCRLYTQLESMRFGKKLKYVFNIDETIDIKSIKIPALIVQPFIENAIWHGIMPRQEGGTLAVNVKKSNESVCCIIDDDGIGREVSNQNKFETEYAIHQSKGVRLTQRRLDLDKALNQRNALVEIFDKKDEKGNATGTTVILTFTEY